jgi:hypothetical protein
MPPPSLSPIRPRPLRSRPPRIPRALSSTELAQVVIHVGPTPASPFTSAETGKYGMGWPFARTLGDEALHEIDKSGHVLRELPRWCPRSRHLVDLRRRTGASPRPWQRRTQGDPLDQGPREPGVARRRGWTVAQRTPECVGQMAHHLPTRHPTPLTRRSRGQARQPLHELRDIVTARESLHALHPSSARSCASSRRADPTRTV